MYRKNSLDKTRVITLCFTAVLIGFLAIVVAKVLLLSIAFFTNLFWFQRFSIQKIELGDYHFSPMMICIPIVGGFLVGLMARFGSKAIRGHGIPEVMENILTKESKIPRRLTFLKPLSAAIAIGSGGPFGAEGPIIATGSALGSWIGRHLYFKESERKVLLAAGAAAGMTAIFGTPLSAVFICIELLLFEFSATTFVPILIAVSVTYSIRIATKHTHAEFPIRSVEEVVNSANSLFYFCAGAITGVVACFISKTVFFIEDLFEKLPIHWMWWPMLGGLCIGIVGIIDTRTLGVGYSNIINSLQGNMLLIPAISLFIFKFISWSIALSSGTSGGTLAPLLTFGSSLGIILSFIGRHFFPDIGILPEVTALVCMSSMFSGATRAILTSTVFALEVTGTHFGIAPLLLGNSAAYLISLFFFKETIMTNKIIIRGVHVPSEYFAVKN